MLGKPSLIRRKRLITVTMQHKAEVRRWKNGRGVEAAQMKASRHQMKKRVEEKG